jgi:type I restriction enzyme S subunit
MSSKTKPIRMSVGAIPALVPKLRFPEFRGTDAWQLYVLEDLENLGWVELGRGEVISAQDIKAIPGNYPIYSSSVKNNGLMGTYGQFIFDEELISWSVDGGGDFFHRPRHKFSVTNVSGYMRLNTNHLNYRFTASQLQALHSSLTFDYQFKAHPSVIRKLYRLAIPSLREQQKIAECLSSVDALLTAQAQKVDALKAHKKGLMQQLFPREGETQPRLRFPEFQNTRDWTEDALGNVCHILNNRRRPITSSDRKSGPYRYFGASGIVDYVDDYIFDERLVLVGEDGAKWDSFEKTAFIVEGKFWVNNHAHVLKPYRVNDTLLENFLIMMDLGPFVTGAAPPKLTLGKLKEISIPIPSSEKEGQTIAACLGGLDDLIVAEIQKLEILKVYKKGLIQQLFPSSEEV